VQIEFDNGGACGVLRLDAAFNASVFGEASEKGRDGKAVSGHRTPKASPTSLSDSSYLCTRDIDRYEGTISMKETDCGQVHADIEEAIRHARQNLNAVALEPYWGARANKMANFGNVVGYQTEDGLKRWRLDYDPVKGVHVNEEHSKPTKKIVHRIAHHVSEYMMTLYWQKWTRRYDKPDWLIEREEELKRQWEEQRRG
jgi:hypothetical protein